MFPSLRSIGVNTLLLAFWLMLPGGAGALTLVFDISLDEIRGASAVGEGR